MPKLFSSPPPMQPNSCQSVDNPENHLFNFFFLGQDLPEETARQLNNDLTDTLTRIRAMVITISKVLDHSFSSTKCPDTDAGRIAAINGSSSTFLPETESESLEMKLKNLEVLFDTLIATHAYQQSTLTQTLVNVRSSVMQHLISMLADLMLTYFKCENYYNNDNEQQRIWPITCLMLLKKISEYNTNTETIQHIIQKMRDLDQFRHIHALCEKYKPDENTTGLGR